MLFDTGLELLRVGTEAVDDALLALDNTTAVELECGEELESID